MFDEIPAQIWLLIAIAATAYAPTRYIYEYIVHSPRYHDITEPSQDLSWRTRGQFLRTVALLTGLLAVAIFIFTPEAEHFARSAAFLPSLFICIGAFALYSAGSGLLKGEIQPLVKGYSRTYERDGQPKRFWASFFWNSSFGLMCGWAAFATIAVLDEQRCFDRQDRYTPQEELDACNGLLAEEKITKDRRANIFPARGQAYHRSGDYKSALGDYNKALSLDANSSYSIYNRALSHQMLGNYESTVSDYNQSLKLRPDNYEAYFNRGLLLFGAGSFDQAISDFTKAHHLQPGNEWPVANRGIAHALKHDRELAQQDFEAVRRINPANPVLLRGEAFLAMQAGEFRQAVEKSSQALRIDPKDIWSLKTRSDAYWRLGETEKSRNDDDRVWELSEQSSNAQPIDK